jgi:hypothetical protein
MGWTPPTKFTVFITFLLMAFGIFILMDVSVIFWDDLILPTIHILDLANFQSWLLVAMIVFFVSWIIFYLGIRLSGM